MNCCWGLAHPSRPLVRHAGGPAFELGLWGGVEKGGGRQRPAKEADSQETVCISVVGTCFRIWAREHSTLICPLMGRRQGGPTVVAHSTPCPTHLTSALTPPTPRQGAKDSPLLPAPSPASLPGPAMPAHFSQPPSLWGEGFLRSRAPQVGTCSVAPEPKAFDFSLFVFILAPRC